MRSMLFVPGDSPRKFEKASEGKADALIIDLEDSVVTDKKPEARGLTLAMLKGSPRPASALCPRQCARHRHDAAPISPR